MSDTGHDVGTVISRFHRNNFVSYHDVSTVDDRASVWLIVSAGAS